MIKTMLKLVRQTLKRAMYQFDSGLVIMFHHVTDSPRTMKSGCLVSTENFEKIINNLGDVVSCEDMTNRHLKELKGKTSITFDDGLEDIYTVAYPILKKKGIPFTIFVINDFLDTDGYINKSQLLEMAKDSLVTIGAHGMTHEILINMKTEQKWKEISESKIGLEKIIGKKVNIFAYSHGQYDNECLQMVKKAGYIEAFGVRALPINCISSKWRMCLPRYNIVDQNVEEFEQIRKRIFHCDR